jgi:hypothetical protein
VRRWITWKFLSYQWDLNKLVWGNGKPVEQIGCDPDRVRDVAKAWGERVVCGDAIVTFNWDILREIILWRSGKWSYRDGYGFECGKQGDHEVKSPTLILKLHGSVNWVQSEARTCVDEIDSVADLFQGSKDWDPRTHIHQAQTDSGRKLILPTYLKDITSNGLLLKTWTRAHDLVANAREIIVIGYSLNKADHPARLLLGTALSANRKANEITVVGPDLGQWDEFASTVGKRFYLNRGTFETWVME